ncbi:MAG: hypothetical protein COU42_02850 [Candidatus Nealsonbacteria bacterium CG10_big_fil_rev_8_21_14_0_10_36_24]|uniref:N-acetylmuramoyl-L-alanine amidase n=2 Tax=Candidatus Nealsoniibacteriota TaxID=1817911 RepID=A0A2H0YNS8_9BACT|nr:MAG: hypothetical protein COU42_02850 [Candidatus Nealsonbacteria bacterium CG10_big_fil_rev_8_21_14_0_10_36_24]PIS40138.1 MAG: hypothetical protein COT32_01375 [Candidatus Nealsonbacteria bacterium CG08_land_8_20_14_0_20_36_22]
MLLFDNMILRKEIKIILLLFIFVFSFGFLAIAVYFVFLGQKNTEIQLETQLGSHFPTKDLGEYIFTDWGGDTPSDSLNIINKIVSWGYKIPSSPRSIDTIIIHSSYDVLGNNPYSVDGVIYEFKIYGVAAHYLIDRNGIIYHLVEEKNIAYHAGRGKMPDGRTNINNFSIGIELINTKTVGPNEHQYKSLIGLVKLLNSKYKIENILGHNQIASARKTDPWNFDWQKFNEGIKN